MHIASADYNALKQLKTFENKAELNNTIRAFLYHYKHKLTPAAIQTLKIISRFAVKIPGVCWAKIGTIAELAEKTSRTIHRALNLLEEIGIIKRIKTIRKNGGYGHPVIIIQPMPGLSLPDDVTSDVRSEMSHRQEPTNADKSSDQPARNDSETMIFKTKSFRENKTSNISNIRKANVEKDKKSWRLTKEFTAEWVPKEFRDFVGSFYDDAEQIEEFWRVVHNQTKLIKKHYDRETILDLAIRAFKDFVVKVKKGVRIKNPFGYFYGILDKKLDNFMRQDQLDMEQDIEEGYEPAIPVAANQTFLLFKEVIGGRLA